MPSFTNINTLMWMAGTTVLTMAVLNRMKQTPGVGPIIRGTMMQTSNGNGGSDNGTTWA